MTKTSQSETVLPVLKIRLEMLQTDWMAKCNIKDQNSGCDIEIPDRTSNKVLF